MTIYKESYTECLAAERNGSFLKSFELWKNINAQISMCEIGGYQRLHLNLK